MAITKMQANIVDAISDWALVELNQLDKIARLSQMYSAENVGNLTDADIQTLAELAHITVAELTGAKNAMDTILVNGGGYAVNTIMTRLSKVVKNIR